MILLLKTLIKEPESRPSANWFIKNHTFIKAVTKKIKPKKEFQALFDAAHEVISTYGSKKKALQLESSESHEENPSRDSEDGEIAGESYDSSTTKIDYSGTTKIDYDAGTTKIDYDAGTTKIDYDANTTKFDSSTTKIDFDSGILKERNSSSGGKKYS